jgi:dTDP-glucose 4,6-dehydratase
LIAETDWSIVNLDKLTYAATVSSLTDIVGSPRYEFVQGDVGDADLLGALFARSRFDAVIHLAAETHVDRSISNPGPFVSTNIVGTFTLLNAALCHWRSLRDENSKHFRFLHVSTDEVFGSLPAEGCFTESSPYSPRSPYAATKAAADHLVSAWGHTYGLPVMISNCSNNYGAYQFPEKLIPLTILNVMAGHAVPIYGDGGQVRDWLHVDDHARALKLILERGEPQQTYGVGGDAQRTNLDVAKEICRLVGGEAGLELISFVEDRPGHDRRYAMDSSKLRRELGWRPRVDLPEGLASTVKWYQDNRAWWEPLRQIYSGERLGAPRADLYPVAP